MNRMLDEAGRMRATHFLRLDDDVVPVKPKRWLRRLLGVMHRHETRYRTRCIVGPTVHGLFDPPKKITDIMLNPDKAELVPILGGIMRLHPMSVVRYFRWNERLPMGASEAAQLAQFCVKETVPMLRDPLTVVTHGGSTQVQIAEDHDWALEHDMYQCIPYGL